jgi:hypothetical protein
MQSCSSSFGTDSPSLHDSDCFASETRRACRIKRNTASCSISSSAASFTDLDKVEFRDLGKLDIVGIYPSYASAYAAWKARAQQTVDNAHMRYFIVHMHRLLDPGTDTNVGR